MGEPTNTEISDHDLLIMATALHGSSAQDMADGSSTACGRPILRQALFWKGLWNEHTRVALYGEHDNPAVRELYETLIGMCRMPEAIIKGFGNLGTDELPPSWPTYTAFGLSEVGRQRAESLLAMHPQLRTIGPVDA